MKILYVQNLFGALGPAKVDEKVIPLIKENVFVIKSKNKILKAFEILVKIILSDCVILSSLSNFNILAIKATKIFRKKSIYFMHGSAEMESILNGIHNSQKNIEEFSIYKSDKIICVSKMFCEYVINNYQISKEKISVINNGIEWSEQFLYDKKCKHSIITTGGTDKRKNNIEICKAVDLLKSKYDDISLTIIDNPSCNFSNEPMLKYPFVNYLQSMEQKELFKLFAKTNIYIQNSYYETFGLAIAEALNQGCNLVLAKDIGIRDVINLPNEYIIEDNDNIEEIAEKIENAIIKPNNKLLLEGIDKNKTSWQNCANNIVSVVKEIVK